MNGLSRLPLSGCGDQPWTVGSSRTYCGIKICLWLKPNSHFQLQKTVGEPARCRTALESVQGDISGIELAEKIQKGRSRSAHFAEPRQPCRKSGGPPWLHEQTTAGRSAGIHQRQQEAQHRFWCKFRTGTAVGRVCLVDLAVHIQARLFL